MKLKVITIDGPSGVGKGTTSRVVAHTLGWNYLDSGAIYRVLAYAACLREIDSNDVPSLVDLAHDLDVSFSCNKSEEPQVFLNHRAITAEIRTSECGMNASKLSIHQPVRNALLERQRRFLTDKGLVADGRDMGTIVFPGAPLKVFLTATPEVRADRRFKQLQRAGVDVSIADLLREVRERDERDTTRSVAPLKPAPDAVVIDTSTLSVQEVCDRVLTRARIIFA
ncbi:MAG: (d)CMP kinase [Gammaproteobacteria bacterium]|nr:(d)CMP kinase [Gammaproteobacteria bacterium]